MISELRAVRAKRVRDSFTAFGLERTQTLKTVFIWTSQKLTHAHAAMQLEVAAFA